MTGGIQSLDSEQKEGTIADLYEAIYNLSVQVALLSCVFVWL